MRMTRKLLILYRQTRAFFVRVKETIVSSREAVETYGANGDDSSIPSTPISSGIH